MITVNSIYNQISDDLQRSDMQSIKKSNKETDTGNTFQHMLNSANDLNSIDTALQLASLRYGVAYDTIKDKLSNTNDFTENAKSFLYGLAIATSGVNTDQVNTVLAGTSTALPYNNITPLLNIGTLAPY